MHLFAGSYEAREAWVTLVVKINLPEDKTEYWWGKKIS